jgi:hypothetical protein
MQELEIHEINGTLLWTGAPVVATLGALYAVFVEQAPFREEREMLWDSYLLWDRTAAELMPEGQVFMDGNFLAHGDSAPRDIDVFVVAPSSSYRSLNLDERRRIFNSVFENGLLKFKPFGMIDASWCDAANPSACEYWSRLWSSTRSEDGSISEDRRKGYVEVLR